MPELTPFGGFAAGTAGGITRHIVWAWVLTIPGSALLGAGIFRVLAPLLR